MYTHLLLIHSLLRFMLLILLLLLVLNSLNGWQKNKNFTSQDNLLSLWVMIFTHIQLLFGLMLYFTSPNVQFNAASMKDSILRYWLVEHSIMMILAIILITLGRIKTKKINNAVTKFKHLFVWNGIALVIIIVTILMSGRSLFGITY